MLLFGFVEIDTKKGSLYLLDNPTRFLRVGESEITQISSPECQYLKLVAVPKSPEEKMKFKSRLLKNGIISFIFCNSIFGNYLF